MIRNKPKVYKEEREELLNKIYEIIGVTENNKQFSSNIIDHDNVLSLTPYIVKYFAVSNWAVFKCKTKSHIALSLIKCLLKAMKVKFEMIGSKKLHINDKYVNITTYIIK